jgi:pimeloyl-ACP methyl ester carboxylesterase
MLTASKASLEIGGHEIYYETAGRKEKPAVVLLHHGVGSTRSWKAQMDALPEAGFYTVAYDRWGFGKSSQRQALALPYFEEDQADLLALLDELELEKASLVGHSDGGTLGLYLAANNPKRVQCLVTIAAHIYVEPKMEPGIESVRNAFENDPRFRAGLQRLHADKTEAVFYNWYRGWTKPENLEWDMRLQLKKIACPVLVVQGEDDEHATPRHARDIADNICNSELWLLAGAGHMLPQEQSLEFNQRLVEFLNQHATKGEI